MLLLVFLVVIVLQTDHLKKQISTTRNKFSPKRCLKEYKTMNWTEMKDISFWEFGATTFSSFLLPSFTQTTKGTREKQTRINKSKHKWSPPRENRRIQILHVFWASVATPNGQTMTFKQTHLLGPFVPCLVVFATSMLLLGGLVSTAFWGCLLLCK